MKTDNNDRQLIRDLYILFLAFYNRGKNSNDIFFLIVELENIYGEKNYLDNIDDIKSVREEVVGEFNSSTEKDWKKKVVESYKNICKNDSMKFEIDKSINRLSSLKTKEGDIDYTYLKLLNIERTSEGEIDSDDEGQEVSDEEGKKEGSKTLFNLGILLLLVIYIFLFVLAGKYAGFLMPSLLVLLSALGYYFAQKLPTKKIKYKNAICFNPSEFYFYFPIIIIDIFSIFYYYNLSSEFQHFNFNNFVLLFLLYSTLLPSIILFTIIYKNNNDRVLLTEEAIDWTDNKNSFKFTYLEIKSIELKSENYFWIFPKYRILLKLNNKEDVIISTYKMNINTKGVLTIYKYINSLHSKNKSFNELLSEVTKIEKIEIFVQVFEPIYNIIKQLLQLFIYKVIVYVIAIYIGRFIIWILKYL